MSDQLNRIQEKLIILAKKHEELNKENHKFKNIITNLENTIEKLKNQILLLEPKVNAGLMSHSIKNSIEKKALEKIITDYIKNIDYCIEFINNTQKI